MIRAMSSLHSLHRGSDPNFPDRIKWGMDVNSRNLEFETLICVISAEIEKSGYEISEVTRQGPSDHGRALGEYRLAEALRMRLQVTDLSCHWSYSRTWIVDFLLEESHPVLVWPIHLDLAWLAGCTEGYCQTYHEHSSREPIRVARPRRIHRCLYSRLCSRIDWSLGPCWSHSKAAYKVTVTRPALYFHV